jgi:hypothetical protein
VRIERGRDAITMARRILITLSLTAILSLVVACGDEPERLAPGAKPAAASSQPAAPMPRDVNPHAARFAGQISLRGTLTAAKEGCVFVSVWKKGDVGKPHVIPSYSKKYAMNDAGWASAGDLRVLHFTVDERDNLMGTAVPDGTELVLEARYDPDGNVDTKDGVESAQAPIRVGQTDFSIVLTAAGAK